MVRRAARHGQRFISLENYKKIVLNFERGDGLATEKRFTLENREGI